MEGSSRRDTTRHQARSHQHLRDRHQHRHRLSADAGLTLPKGASAAVVAAAASLASAKGGAAFLDFAKAHFKTADDALAKISRTRASEGLPPASERRPFIPRRPAPPPSP